ncbi:hypothetical protein [Segniliparus rugosus]|uniref:Uncharacterized protein n=1 Tax=Segniliparus rugosus (strain ATCC BAA-974 / DSM 45345 / CCUG 50838 / CIP 108380 / JCM 13579 / CDC 945) TaxID=679197 RepID=E5XKY1_SEGRC|nr:hypothetical protein [Segniliparus rugosus]EFV14963.1 hypothetical protein HMPREF9336_00150 [Segniliparus rugosus ATCC BAA-974]
MSDFVARAQTYLLADLLGVPLEKVSHLERLGPENLAQLRMRISDLKFDAQEQQVAAISKVAPMVPDPVVATLAEKVVGPMVAAAVANSLAKDHADRLNGLLRRLRVPFVAQTLRYLDPRTVPTLTAVVPIRVWAPAVRRLLADGHYASAAVLMEQAPVDLLLAVEREVDDREAITRTLAYTTDSQKLEELLAALPEERLLPIVDSFGTGKAETIMAGFSALTRISSSSRHKLATLLVGRLDDEGMARFAQTVVEAGGEARLRELVQENLEGGELARALAAIDGQLV